VSRGKHRKIALSAKRAQAAQANAERVQAEPRLTGRTESPQGVPDLRQIFSRVSAHTH